jgi:hypothetical protein
MQLDAETMADQQELLAQHRRRLSYRLRQQARQGSYAPPDVALDIEEAQAAIRDLKAHLRTNGVVVNDLPEDSVQAMIATTRLAPADRRNRSAMLQKVRAIWVRGLLEHSLADEARIALDLEERPDTVHLPLNAQVQELRRSARMFPSGTPTADVFDALGGELLILGEPGAGKTTMLLELARDLLDRAGQDESHPIPVVFNLSSWAPKRSPLIAWLIDELNTVYDVPRKVGQAWLDGDALLLLLDGLDEVNAEHRAACVQAINSFRREHGSVDLAVCSRIADYEAINEKLKLQGAVLIQPLTAQQIDAYLEHAGVKLAALRAAFEYDAALQLLAKSPLLLSIMALACHDMPVDAQPTGDSTETNRRYVFAAYVDRMFARRGADMRFSREQTTQWLAWLARGMQRQGQSVFLIEQLQPDLLPTSAARMQYVLLDRLGWGLVILLFFVMVFGLIGGLIGGLEIGLVFALILGLGGGVLDASIRKQPRLTQLAANALLGGLVGALGSGLIVGLVGGLNVGPAGVLVGGLFGSLEGLFSGRPSVRLRWIMVVERLRWSWRKALRRALGGLIFGLVFGLVGRLAVGLEYGFNEGVGFEMIIWLGLALVFGLFFGLIFGLVGGLDSGGVTATITPNQGIRRSARSASLSGLVFALVFALVFGLPFAPVAGLGSALLGGLLGGLGGGLLGGLAFGGYACLSHIALRLVLWRQGAMPLNYVRFLDYCAERIFLRKVGGGYIFVHRLLLEHFAGMEHGTTE